MGVRAIEVLLYIRNLSCCEIDLFILFSVYQFVLVFRLKLFKLESSNLVYRLKCLFVFRDENQTHCSYSSFYLSIFLLSYPET